MGTGVDAKRVRRQGRVLTAVIAAQVLAFYLIYRTSKYSASARTSKSSTYSDGALSSQGFTSSDISRIQAQQARVRSSASEFQIDQDLINAVIWVESRFRPRAQSGAGAMGLMQLMPGTEEWLASQLNATRQDPFDPAYNIRLGTFYLRRLFSRYGDMDKVLAAYNWGPGNLDSGKPWPSSVSSYVSSVKAADRRFSAARSSA